MKGGAVPAPIGRPAALQVEVLDTPVWFDSAAFAKKDGGRGLMGLAKELQGRCDLVIKLKGERIPK